ncbi:MAG: hypothetical protein Q9178_006013 [Gyalolechia marmorata]
MAQTTLHLRSETKYLERRTALTPTSAKALIDSGYKINVERSTGRVFRDEEYQAAGAHLVPGGTWPSAPRDHIIVGLKELPKDDALLIHDHIHFGHCYKRQENWDGYLSRFALGGGVLYDIEFLTHPPATPGTLGKRVAAFGYYAGFAGAAIALLAWAHQLIKPTTPLPSVMPSDYPSQSHLEKAIKQALEHAIPINDSQPPRVIVIGALGRCGTGAVECCRAVDVIPDSFIEKWDMDETEAGGPFCEIVGSDIFINCIYLSQPIAPFVTTDSLSEPGRRLRVISDVSCDPSDPNNPVPLYHQNTTFVKPTLSLAIKGDGPDLTMISIDHLPSLVAREASEDFSGLALPSLKTLNKRDEPGVWKRAEKVFREKSSNLLKDIRLGLSVEREPLYAVSYLPASYPPASELGGIYSEERLIQARPIKLLSLPDE